MKKCLLILAGAVMALVVGCSGGPSAQAPTATSEPPPPTQVAVPTAITAGAPSDQDCIDCHQDKDSLISTAKQEEAVEEESEGAG